MFLLTSLPEAVKLLFMNENISVFPFLVTRYPLKLWLLLSEPVFPKI